MSNKTRITLVIVGSVVMLVGVLGLIYPSVGNYINTKEHKSIVQNYKEEVETMEESKTNSLLLEARAYNERLYERGDVITGLNDDEIAEYNSILAMSVTGIMGYLDIPSIDVSLPIYHGTSEAVLQVGIGHLEGSSFPVGGKNTNAVLTGHSGLPTSELLTNLDQLREGDLFSVTVLENTTTYVVERVEIVLPDDVVLNIEEGGDCCTLITCTPIGANTHRIVVYGRNVDNDSAESAEVSQKLQ